MKIVALFTVLVIVFVAVLRSSDSDAAEGAATENQSQDLLRHVVVFRFQDNTRPEDIERIEQAFARLPGQIPAIRGFEWGVNNSPEGLNDGFTHCFLVTFADEAGRDEYLPHPAHLRFVEVLKPHLDKAFVIDFTAR